MARYRKVDQRMWGDAKFRLLTPLQPSGQALWLWLLTGPFTGPIPGLFSAGPAGMAERLGWAEKAFREAFLEVTTQSMLEADLEAPLLWIPKAIAYNPPQSPNVVKSWSATWDELPECVLKSKAWHRLHCDMKAFGEAFLEAFCDACGKPLRNQEQEQEQEKEIVNSPGGEPPQLRQNGIDPRPLFDAWNRSVSSVPKAQKLTDKRAKHCKARLKEQPDLDWWHKLFSRIDRTPFLRGENDRGWMATFDWIIGSQDAAVKVLEGKYDTGNGNSARSLHAPTHGKAADLTGGGS